MPILDPIIVAGGGVSGWCAAGELRRLGFGREIILIGGPASPFYPPALSKELLAGQKSVAQINSPSAEEISRLSVTHLANEAAETVDPETRTVSLRSGNRARYSKLLIATGSAPLVPHIPGINLPGVYTLRTVDDAVGIAASLVGNKRIAIIGGGFIGCEVAAACRHLGLEVVLLEALAHPLMLHLGANFGRFVEDLHRSHGVDVVTNARVSGIAGVGQVEEVTLEDGRAVAADVVIVGVGSRPQVSMAAKSGVSLEDGIVVDGTGWSGIDGIYAAGDVARWTSSLAGSRVRVEHWTNAVHQGRSVARSLLGLESPHLSYDHIPYFWTDQYDTKIQLVGFTRGSEYDTVQRPGGDSFAVTYERRGRLMGVLAVNWPQTLGIARRALAAAQSARQATDDLRRMAVPS